MNYNNPYNPPYSFGPTYTLDPSTNQLVTGADGRYGGFFNDAALKFAVPSIVPIGQSIVSATLTLNITLTQTNPAAGSGSLASFVVSGLASDSKAVSLTDFNLKTTNLGMVTEPGNILGGGGFPLITAVLNVTSFLQSSQTNGATAAEFFLDPYFNTIVFSSPLDDKMAYQPTLSIIYGPSAVPEPASLLTASMGLAIALVVARWRSKMNH